MRNNPNPTVRKFEFFPKLFDSEATDYSKMIPIEKLTSRQKTVPPLIIGLIKDLGIDEVVRLILLGNLPVLKVACHSQVVMKSGSSTTFWVWVEFELQYLGYYWVTLASNFKKYFGIFLKKNLHKN